MNNAAIFSIATFPPIAYFTIISNYDIIWLERCENYQKQSYRNRWNILTANGVQSLSIPIVHASSKTPITEVAIDYKTNWQSKFWKAIESAYNNSPYFLYYQDYFYPFFETKIDSLFEYNNKILQILFKLLQLQPDLRLTEHFEPQAANMDDYRASIHPKLINESHQNKPYPQVFDTKFPFQQNLSILDLIFNLGNESGEYFRK